jgi:glutamyl-tRNA synthetase
MDDTNPLVESHEYENAILEDLTKLGIDVTNYTNSSNYFAKLLECAELLIKKDLAYVDLTDKDGLRKSRENGIETIFRNNNIEKNLEMFDNMVSGTLKTGCVRLKIDMNHKNKAMRDPSIYRPINSTHHITKDKYKIYPMYDFACPIIDVLEGVTHVFRSTEFQERDDQYNFILSNLGYSVPKLYHYGKLMFAGVEMSKRKIKAKIENKSYSGWDDPRLFTLRGLFNRGLNINILEEFMKQTGYPPNLSELESSAIWTINKKFVDKIATRYSVLSQNLTELKIIDNNNIILNNIKHVLRFNRNPSLGTREHVYSENILVNTEELKLVNNLEEITLMHYGNMIYDKNNNSLTTNLTGDVKTTKTKLLWISKLSDINDLVTVNIITFDGENIKELKYYGEYDLINNKIGDYVQFYKMNYYQIKNIDNINKIVTVIELPN